jgi:DNA helicase HerA-like ATPase
MHIDDFFPRRDRLALARKIAAFQLTSAQKWSSGPEFDIEEFVNWTVKPNIAVFSLRHLSEEDRQFFCSLLFNKIVRYMYSTSASETLKLAVILDEARGYLPPHPHNPTTKAPICTLLAQARAQGIGLVIGTQNPMDLDYKALSNVGTWFLGKLRERDCARDLLAEFESRGLDKSEVLAVPSRRFLMLEPSGKTMTLRVRWPYNHLYGPVSVAQMLNMPQRF